MANQPYFTITITPKKKPFNESDFPERHNLAVHFDGDLKHALFAYASVVLEVPQLLMDACKGDPEKEAAWRDFIALLWKQISSRKPRTVKDILSTPTK